MPESGQFQPNDNYNLAVTISNGQTENATGIDLQGTDICGLFIPAEFDGTALSFKAANTLGGTYYPVQFGGATYTLTTTASRYCPIENLAVLIGVRFVKLVCGTAQTGDTVITLATRAV